MFLDNMTDEVVTVGGQDIPARGFVSVDSDFWRANRADVLANVKTRSIQLRGSKNLTPPSR